MIYGKFGKSHIINRVLKTLECVVEKSTFENTKR